jgi:hypothetical protein
VVKKPSHLGEVLDADREAALLDFARRGGFIDRQVARLDGLAAHGNRTLKIGQLFGGLLLSFFDPLARSLRTIEDKADFGGYLDLPRLARSTTSDALAALDASRLRPIINELLARVPQLAQTDGDLACITRQIIAADGTYMTTLSDVAWALRHTRRNGRRQGQIRANVQMDTETWTPRVVSISGDDQASEPSALAGDLLSGVLYVLDRNFLDFDFLTALLAKDNDFVLRVKDNAPSTAILQNLELTVEDAQAGVISDQIVQLTGVHAPEGKFRLVTIQTTNRQGDPETIRLLSNLTDATTIAEPAIAARVIGLIYRKRWQIELFFKWLKTFARMNHLISTSRNGITFQFYVAVISVLLMYVQSGKRVSIYALAALSRLARGECTLEQALAVIAKRERERDLERRRQARKRAAKTPA